MVPILHHSDYQLVAIFERINFANSEIFRTLFEIAMLATFTRYQCANITVMYKTHKYTLMCNNYYCATIQSYCVIQK